MKVVFIGNDKSLFTRENGDAFQRHQEYAKNFSELVIVVFTLKKDGLKPKQNGNLKLVPTNSDSRWGYISDSLKLLAEEKPIDLISTQDPFIAGLAGVLAKLLFGMKLNIQIHNDFFGSPYFRQENLQNYIFYWLGKFTLLFADSVRVVNKRLKIGTKSFVAPVAVDLNYFHSKPHTKVHNQIVTVARLAKQKNLPLFFDLAKEFPDKKFIVVGEGEERNSLEKLLPNNVILVGQKTRQEIRDIFAQSDIFALTSNYEGWGLVVVEALAAGLPVVVTDTGCAGTVVNNKAGGFVVPPGDLSGMIGAVRMHYNDAKKSRDLVRSAQKSLMAGFSQKKVMDQFLTGLKETQ